MALGRGAVLPLPSGYSASNPVVSSNPSVSDGYFTLVQFFPHPRSLPSYPSLFTGCGVLGFALSTIPKVSPLLFFLSTLHSSFSDRDPLPCPPRFYCLCRRYLLHARCRLLHYRRSQGGTPFFSLPLLSLISFKFYVWNLGFPALFPKFVDNRIQFPVSQTMQIELGLTGAVALMGIAVQLRILKVLQRKLEEIAEEAKRQDEEAEFRAADRLNDIQLERDAWEKDHPTLSKHGRQDSTLSSTVPLIKDREDSPSPVQPHTQHDSRTRHVSGLSDFNVAPTSDEDLKRSTRFVGQTPGALPTLDLGTRIQEDVPVNYISNHTGSNMEISPAELEDFKRKQSLLAEIQTIRRSIDILKSESPISPTSSEQSRRPSFASRRTLSVDAGNALLPMASHIRPPRERAPRDRVQSLEFSSLAARGYSSDDPISRPTSVPLKDDWDSYIQERKLLQPPAGVTPPIATTPSVPRAPLSPAVQDALQQRKRRESVLGGGLPTPSTGSSEDVPLARVVQQHKSPVTILPPRRPSAAAIVAPTPQSVPARTRTFEELTERHREKMRDMQAPLTQAEKENAELEAARQRWERAKALEKEAVTRRQAEKAAALEKKKKTESSHRHTRSLSADKLANQGTPSSRRLSTLKVEGWQRYQQDAEMGVKPAGEGGAGKRDSRNMRSAEGVPFPGRKSRDF